MAEIKQIKPADLQIDEENPRILEPNVGQPKALHAIAEETKGKLLIHAADIAKHGLDPSALLIVEELQGIPAVAFDSTVTEDAMTSVGPIRCPYCGSNSHRGDRHNCHSD